MNNCGFEYSYRISTTNDKTMITDELIRRFRPCLLVGMNTFVFEIRTNFILRKKTKTSSGVAAAADDDDDVLLDSEKFCVDYLGSEWLTQGVMGTRLKEYWMPEDKIQKLTREALDFANRLPRARKHGTTFRNRVTPVVVEIEVRTVEQEGEGLAAAMDRAIRVDSLFPLFLWKGTNPDIHPNVENYLVSVLPRERVQDVDELGLMSSLRMETCPICLRNPTVGSQVSILPQCKHAFHYHCIAGWLMKNNTCPSCRESVYRIPKLLTQKEIHEIRHIAHTLV